MNQIIVTDLKMIKNMLSSCSVASWGNGPIPDTDLYQLASVSPQRKGEQGIQFVCSASNLNKARSE